MQNGATLLNGWADALGQALAHERVAWQRERDLAVAEHGRQIAELRADHFAFRERMREAFEARLAMMVRDQGPIGPPGQPGETGPAGPPGDTPDIQPILEVHQAWLRERDAVVAEHQAMLARLDELRERLENRLATLRDGEDGEPGPEGAAGAPGPQGTLPVVCLWTDGVHYRGDVRAHRGATWQAFRDTAREPGAAGDDWILLAAAGRDAAEGEVHGQFEPGRDYRKFDLVCFDGCEWRARCDDPGPLPGAGWALSAVQGKRGGKGERGERGEKGAAGPAGATISDWIVDGYCATPLLSDGTLGPSLELRRFFELYHGEASA
jgi:hypothetical protein